jgi:hypothetical protein
MMTKTERLSTPASGSFDGNSRPLGEVGVDMAKRLCMIRVPRRAWLVGLGLAVGIILAAGGSAGADPLKPSCRSVTNGTNVFKILDNQTYALCAVASCFFNGVAYCKCDVKTGDSISLSLEFDEGEDVCTVNEEGVENGYMVSTYSVPDSVLKPNGDMASYTCPSGSDGAYAQCDGGICFKSTRGSHFRVSMSPWRKTRSSAPVRSPSRARKNRWAIKSPALIPASNRSSTTARARRPTRRLARRCMSALQPVPAAFCRSSSLA